MSNRRNLIIKLAKEAIDSTKHSYDWKIVKQDINNIMTSTRGTSTNDSKNNITLEYNKDDPLSMEYQSQNIIEEINGGSNIEGTSANKTQLEPDTNYIILESEPSSQYLINESLLSALLALYEHKIHVFDQWLSFHMASKLRTTLHICVKVLRPVEEDDQCVPFASRCNETCRGGWSLHAFCVKVLRPVEEDDHCALFVSRCRETCCGKGWALRTFCTKVERPIEEDDHCAPFASKC
uniref:Uncharacterized protein n=1 Tax=Timema monikensis TaxID=170555 RepID=A0A7R9EIV1_9NEOP|nr:unnamed protein product [Timema monikensis]